MRRSGGVWVGAELRRAWTYACARQQHARSTTTTRASWFRATRKVASGRDLLPWASTLASPRGGGNDASAVVDSPQADDRRDGAAAGRSGGGTGDGKLSWWAPRRPTCSRSWWAQGFVATLRCPTAGAPGLAFRSLSRACLHSRSSPLPRWRKEEQSRRREEEGGGEGEGECAAEGGGALACVGPGCRRCLVYAQIWMTICWNTIRSGKCSRLLAVRVLRSRSLLMTSSRFLARPDADGVHLVKCDFLSCARLRSCSLPALLTTSIWGVYLLNVDGCFSSCSVHFLRERL